MHIVTLVGDARVGKSALCEQWSSGLQTSSYISTLDVNHYTLSDLTLHDMPSEMRFHTKTDIYFSCSDVFVLVGNQDADSDSWWARIHPAVPTASWLFIWTGKHACPKRRRWAKERGITVLYVNLKDAEQIAMALTALRKVASNHAPRPERVPLGYYEYFVDEARQWMPCV